MLLFFSMVISAEEKNMIMEVDLSEAKDTLIVSKVFISGNKKTKTKIIHNELLFNEGDSLSKQNIYDKIIQSRNNLNNTSLFNFVYINYWVLENEQLFVEVKVDERWYLWTLPIIEQGDRNLSAFLNSGDWSRINYGVYIKKENFRGMNEIVRLKLRLGYLNELQLSYRSAEYNDRLGWGVNICYQGNAQVSFNTLENQDHVIKVDNGFAQQVGEVNLRLKYRHNYVHRHQLIGGYNSVLVADTIADLNPDYLLDGNTSLSFLSLGYNYSIDYRDSKVYPLRGNMFEGNILKSGLGIINNSYDDLSLKLAYYQFGHLYNKFYYGWQLAGKYGSAENNPYIFNKGLGTEDFLNGFEYNVIRGTSYGFSKQKLAYEIVPTQTVNLNFLRLKQFSKLHYAFYVRAFFDSGYVYDANQHATNTMSNSFLCSYGLGIDLVTYYDKVFNFSYATNNFGDRGFYIHLDMSL